MEINTRYQGFIKDCQKSGLFNDGKYIVDALPNEELKDILDAYDILKGEAYFEIDSFFHQNFRSGSLSATEFKSDPNHSPKEHILSLWPRLQRAADTPKEHSSLVPLPYPYVVPGGRFNEIYYWDSYFTMLGLKLSKKEEWIESMVKNFSWMIEQFGFIPNGNREYFKSRSQPPFYSLMVELLAEIKGDAITIDYLAPLQKEYDFWMEGDRVVSLPFGKLNNYSDSLSTPREEMYHDDWELSKDLENNSASLFKNIRAACESGWDFSSRWFRDYQNIASIRTSEIVPVDLNCLLYHLELHLAKAYALKEDETKQSEYEEKAARRRTLIQKYFWNEEKGFYFDFLINENKNSTSNNLAGIFPLFFGISNAQQAKQCTERIKEIFLKPGGLITTDKNSGQQWDAPNGWAPLQYIATLGLYKSGQSALALEIAKRWTQLNETVYENTGKFVEKYNVENLDLEAGGGEYPVQDGFGWSNGVYLALKQFIDDNNEIKGAN